MKSRRLPGVRTRLCPRAAGCLAFMAAMGVSLAGCGSGPVPYDAVSNYLEQIAEGNYNAACGLLDRQARESLIRAMGGRVRCASLFTRCLPSDALNISRDETQLLYASILVTTHGKNAQVTVSGTAVARAVRSVNVAEKHGNWKLTSYGVALQQCPRRARRRRSARG